MRISFDIDIGWRGVSASFRRNTEAATKVAVARYLPKEDEVVLVPTPDGALVNLSDCRNAWEASRLWDRIGQPALPCSPEEMYWRGQPPQRRPAGWQDDPI